VRDRSAGARWRERALGVAVPLAIAVAAGTVAYVGLSRLGFGLAVPPDPELPTTAVRAQLPFVRSREASAPDAGVPRAPLPGAFEFEIEELPVPQDVQLKPGHGLLEVQTWHRQRIYVDGVFVGNYASRRVPLNPGTYEGRLLDGARELERSVQVRAGKRTRLSVSRQSRP
jgi:hypothetical protein